VPIWTSTKKARAEKTKIDRYPLTPARAFALENFLFLAQGAIQIPIPIIASPTTITRESIVSRKDVRFASCWIIA
jgi:hypothetical protein